MSTADGSVGATVKVVDHGPAERRFNIVVVGDGFQTADLAAYRARVDLLVDSLRIIRPTRELWPLINIFRIDVTSMEGGMDHPDTGVARRTFFDATSTGNPREVRCDTRLVHSICRQQVPEHHFPLLIVNDPGDFGTGAGKVAILSLGAPDFSRVAVHELGHSAFGLGDEYDEAKDPAGFFGSEPPEVNVTKNKVPATVKWRAFRATPLPVVPNPDCSKPSANDAVLPAGDVGIVEGARHVHCGLHRPSGTCLMRFTNERFCPVCLDKVQTGLRQFRPVTIERSRFNWISEAVISAAVTLASGPNVVAYAVGSGFAEIFEIAPDGSTLTFKLVQQLTAGWSSVVSLPLTAGAHLLLYNRATGRTEISKVAPDASAITTVFPTQWTTDWSVMISFVLAGQTFLFSYKEGSGRAAIDLIAADGTGNLTMFDGTLDLGFGGFAALERTDFLNPGLAPGGALLVGYLPASGVAVLYLIGDRGTSIRELLRLPTLPFGTAVVPVTAGGEFVLALHNAVSGEVRWLYAGDLGMPLNTPPAGPTADSFSLAELGTSAWSAGWTTLAPYFVGGRTNWLAHRASDGLIVLDRVD